MKIPEAEQEILDDINSFKDRYFVNDEPIPFCGLKLYPVKMKNYVEFLSSISCLTMNSFDDPRYAIYSQLEYLLIKMTD